MQRYQAHTNVAMSRIPEGSFVIDHFVSSSSPGMNARIFRYVSNTARSLSESLNVLEISGYMREDTHCLLRGGLRGSCQGRGQLGSVDKCRPYIYEWPNNSKDRACLVIEIPDVLAFPVVVKKDVSVDVSKPKKKRTRT